MKLEIYGSYAPEKNKLPPPPPKPTSSCTGQSDCWVPCCERLPPNADEVMGWDGYRARIVWYEADTREWFWRDEGRDECWLGDTLTHWMVIPSAPTIF